MCSLIGSFSVDKYKELYELNAYRGTLTSSFTVIDEDSEIVTLNRFDNPERMFEVINNTLFEGDTGCYYLGHSQAPTTSASGVHPAEIADSLLWHNGIIKEKEIDRWNKILGTDFIWDTELLLNIINIYGTHGLSDVDGTFACVLARGKDFYVFRNAIAPLFYDDELNISSTKFKDSKPVPHGKVFRLDFEHKTLDGAGQSFTTKNNPYSL